MKAWALCFACSGLLASFCGLHVAWLIDDPSWSMAGYVVIYIMGAIGTFLIGGWAKGEAA